MPQEQGNGDGAGLDEQLRWVLGRGRARAYLAVSLRSSSAARKREGRGGGGVGCRGGLVTKPIIFTSPPLPASRHVILNGLSDPWAGFEPLENMVSQMKLSQETACVRQPGFSGAPHLSPIKRTP